MTQRSLCAACGKRLKKYEDIDGLCANCVDVLDGVDND